MMHSYLVLLPTAEAAGLSTVKVMAKCSFIDLGNIHHESHIYFLIDQFLMTKTEGS